MIVLSRRSQITDGKGKTKSLFIFCNGTRRSTSAIFLFLFLIFSCISLFPCYVNAEIDDNLKGVPPSDISEWLYYGFEEEESKKWIENGIIFAGWAAQWRDEGFTADAAGRWRKITNVYTAGNFLKNGFDAEEAKKWIENGIHSGLRAREYLSAGLSAEEAAEYWANSIYPDEVKEWHDAGFNAQTMLEWHYGPRESTFFFTKDSPYGRSLYKLEAAIQWRDAGFTAQEMQTSGMYRFELEEAKRWKTAGFMFSEAVQWRDLEFTLHDAARYKILGLHPVAAELQRYDSSHDKPDEITSLQMDITLNKDGSIDVIETVTVIDRPGGMYEHGYYKELPKQARLRSSRSHGYATKEYSGTIFNVKSVEIDGKAEDYDIADNRLHFGSRDRPLKDGEHQIKIFYSTDSRVLYEPHHDEFCFGIIEDNPQGRYVRNASATIRLPKGAHVIFTDGNGGLEGRNNYISRVEETEKGDVVHFTLATPLKTGMSFTTNVGFVKGYVVESRTHKFVKLNRETGGLMTSLAFFAASFAVLLLYYLIVWFKVGRDPRCKSFTTTELSPPENIDPARMRAIHTRGKVDYLSVTAELIYLAELGLIQISGSSEKLKLIKKPVESIQLPSAAKQFYANLWAGIQTELSLTRECKNEVLSIAVQSLRNLLKSERNKNLVSNARYLWPGIIFAVLAVVFSLAIIDYREYDYGKAKIFITVYAGFLTTVFTVLIFIFKRLLRTVTERYARLTVRVKSYADYISLSYADIGTSDFVPSYLQGHLPYAIAIGLDVDKVTILKGDVNWYHGTNEGLKFGDFSKLVKKSL